VARHAVADQIPKDSCWQHGGVRGTVQHHVRRPMQSRALRAGLRRALRPDYPARYVAKATCQSATRLWYSAASIHPAARQRAYA
jgi:hypothetical protein